MLNVFPIQFLALLAYFLLRICVGGIFLYFGWNHAVHQKAVAESLSLPFFPYKDLAVWILIGGELVLGVMFVIGFYTQIAALGAMILSLKIMVFHKRLAPEHLQSRMFYLLLFFAALSLFITGAGAFAFDLPI